MTTTASSSVGGQANFIIFAILAMFVIFITAKGELGTWFGLIAWNPQPQPNTGTNPNPTQVATHQATLGDLVNHNVTGLGYLSGTQVPNNLPSLNDNTVGVPGTAVGITPDTGGPSISSIDNGGSVWQWLFGNP